MAKLRSMDDLPLDGKTVLVRVDLNVPMKSGVIMDDTRIVRLIPTLQSLIARRAKIVLLSHMGRPKGTALLEYSLAPLVDVVSAALGGYPVQFAVDCVGSEVQSRVQAMQPGEIMLLENLRFHVGEEANDPQFAGALAALGDYYVNDSFSCSHRAHASIVGITAHRPSAAGYLLINESERLHHLITDAPTPMMAIVGGAKISSKLGLITHLIARFHSLFIGGAMANTFLKAKGYEVGTSLVEDDLLPIATELMAQAARVGCHLMLPMDVIVTRQLTPASPCRVVPVEAVAADEMIVDIGPATLSALMEAMNPMRSIVWNGPMGAFEVPPFDTGTVSTIRMMAARTEHAGVVTVAGGGDSIASLKRSGLYDRMTYISTGGGAFLEWLEGRNLPGLGVLLQ